MLVNNYKRLESLSAEPNKVNHHDDHQSGFTGLVVPRKARAKGLTGDGLVATCKVERLLGE